MKTWRLVMAKMKPFCGEIWVCSGASSEEIAAAGGLKKSFEEVTAGADYLSVHIPGTPENLHRLDRAAFHRMKRGWIDFDAGVLLAQPADEALQGFTRQLYEAVLDTCNGAYHTRNEENGYYQMGILRDGVTL